MSIIDRLSLEVFGARLRSRRRELDMSQQELAHRMQIPQSWISELENGKQTGLAADTVYRFCRALCVSADYLLGLTEATHDDSLPPR